MSSTNNFKEMLVTELMNRVGASRQEVEQVFKKANNPLMGKWKSNDGDFRFTFASDDRFELMLESVTFKGVFQVIDVNLFTCTDSGEQLVFSIEIGDSKLTVASDSIGITRVLYRD